MEANVVWGHPRPAYFIRRVLVANDASDAAHQAVATADALAARCEAELTVANHATMLRPLHAFRTPRLARQSKSLTGGLVDALTRASANADLVVIGATGHSAEERAARSATALSVVARAASSVWIDRDPPGHDGNRGEPRRILVGVSDSESSQRALRIADELARRLRADLTVAHVVPLETMTLTDPAATRADDYMSTLVVSAHSKLRARMEALHGRENASCHLTVPVGDPSDMLVALAGGFDLIVVGSGRSLERSGLRLGGVASRVAMDAPSSALIVR